MASTETGYQLNLQNLLQAAQLGGFDPDDYRDFELNGGELPLAISEAWEMFRLHVGYLSLSGQIDSDVQF